MQNPILDLINSLNPNTVNTTGLMQGANSRFESGFNSLQSVADNIDKVKTNRKIKELISTADMSDPYAGQQSMLSSLLGVRGVDPKDAMNISSGIANPLIQRNNRAEDVAFRDTKESNLQAYRNRTSAETARHNIVSEKTARYKANNPVANTKTIEDVNPYTGAKSFYQYDSKKSAPEFKKVNIGPQSSVDTVDAPVVASNTKSMPMLEQVVDNGSESNVGAYAANYVEQANANPIDVGMSGAQVAGNVTGAGSNALPSTSDEVTYSKPDRWEVSQGSDGTFREANGNYVIPMKLREVKKVTAEDGSTSYVVINKATGRDASGNVVGDAPKPSVQSIVELPGDNGQIQKYVQTKSNNGTITMKPLEVKGKQFVKEPTLDQNDKQFIDTYGSDIDAVTRINESFGNTGIWGPMDYLTGKIGQLLPEGTPGGLGKEGREQSIVASDLANIKIAAQEAIKGVPSDKDTKTLEMSIPSISDQPEVARAKMSQFQQKLGRINARKVQRLSNSNPSVANQMYKRMHDGDIPVPYGYDLDLTDGKYSLVKEK